MRFKKPCLVCGALSFDQRCESHQKEYERKKELSKSREHYKGTYQTRAKQIRQSATYCWICKGGPKIDDPFTADHLIPADPNSPLAPAHRSCNSRRGNKNPLDIG